VADVNKWGLPTVEMRRTRPWHAAFRIGIFVFVINLPLRLLFRPLLHAALWSLVAAVLLGLAYGSHFVYLNRQGQ
jgi:hypothetical protein